MSLGNGPGRSRLKLAEPTLGVLDPTSCCRDYSNQQFACIKDDFWSTMTFKHRTSLAFNLAAPLKKGLQHHIVQGSHGYAFDAKRGTSFASLTLPLKPESISSAQRSSHLHYAYDILPHLIYPT